MYIFNKGCLYIIMFFISLKAFPQQGVSVNTYTPYDQCTADGYRRLGSVSTHVLAGHTTTSGYFNYIK